MSATDEEDRRDAVGDGDGHVLQRVEPLQVVGEHEAQDRQQDHALGGAEVAAIDAGEERAAVAGRVSSRRRAGVGWNAISATASRIRGGTTASKTCSGRGAGGRRP